MTYRAEVLFIGGCAGVGKTSVATELHVQLSAARVRHCLLEGDNLDLAWPVPWQRGLELAELNLAAIWRTYRAAGYSRLIYTNTAAVRADVMESRLAVLGGDAVVHAVLLAATAAAVAARLAQREIGSALDWHAAHSSGMAAELEGAAPGWVRRIDTDGRTVTEIAQDIGSTLGWSPLAEDL